jgi:hypothetical protein
MSIRKRFEATATRTARKADDDELLSVKEIITNTKAKVNNADKGSKSGEDHENNDKGGEGE